jgi:hypothetical protein
MPCSDPPSKDAEVADHLFNPKTEDENKSSLFGRNPMLDAVRERRRRGAGSDERDSERRTRSSS